MRHYTDTAFDRKCYSRPFHVSKINARFLAIAELLALIYFTSVRHYYTSWIKYFSLTIFHNLKKLKPISSFWAKFLHVLCKYMRNLPLHSTLCSYTTREYSKNTLSILSVVCTGVFWQPLRPNSYLKAFHALPVAQPTVLAYRRENIIMDARSASVHVIFCQCFFSSFFMAALVGQTAERIFTKLSHVVDIRHHLRTY